MFNSTQTAWNPAHKNPPMPFETFQETMIHYAKRNLSDNARLKLNDWYQHGKRVLI